MRNLEACVTTLDAAVAAERNGAHRLEVCEKLDTGGMTPSFQLVENIVTSIQIPVRIMIRETEEDFETNEKVLAKMTDHIHLFKKLPVQGFVLGVLKNNQVDKDALNFLMEAAYPFPITFHKAIDLSADKWNDIEWLNSFPLIDTLLTSGGAEHVSDGINEILKMKSVFKRHVMASGKITFDQLQELHDKLQLDWYHGRSIVTM